MMKTTIKTIVLTFALVGSTTLTAQFADNLLTLSTHEVQGTARFSGMGGAFNALGGDFGSLSVNPAGIGTYRSSEFMITPALSMTSANTDFLQQSASDSRTRFALANIGYVGTIAKGESSGLVSLNFGIGHNKVASFYKSSPFKGNNSRISVLDYYADYATRNGLSEDYLAGEFNNILPEDWSTSMAYNQYMFDPVSSDNGKYIANGLLTGDKVDISGRNYVSGGTDEYTVSLGGNIANKFQFGFTVGIQDLLYENHAIYDETYVATNEGLFTSALRDEYTRISGSGWNVKAGVIYKPIESLRIGLAVHSPTLYVINHQYTVYMESEYYNTETGTDDLMDEESPVDNYEYRLQTPYRIEAGLAFVIGKFGLISADYELSGNNAIRMYDDITGDYEYIESKNSAVRSSFRPTSNFRVGAEVNLPYGIMLRGGFNYFQSPYKDCNLDFDRYAYSCGLGFRSKKFFVDFAYVLNTGKSYFGPCFVNDNRMRDLDVTAGIEYATETVNAGKILATIGFKF